MPVTHLTGESTDAIDGIVPKTVYRPETQSDVVEALRAAASDQRTVVPHGGRSKLGWAAPATSADIALDLCGLSRIIDHAAGDLIVVAEAGVRLSDLQARVASAGQVLALDPAESNATLGGLVSANASGPRRLRYGTARDLLIGITVALPDGTLASAGGRVVKNVAGYDIGKLFIGAHGSLGAVVSTTWRLHPKPPTGAVVDIAVERCAEASAIAHAVAHSPLTPTALEVRGQAGGAGTVRIVFESIPESVAAQTVSAVALLGRGTIIDSVPENLAALPGDPDALIVRIAHPPKQLPAVLAALPVAAEIRASARVGIVEAALTTDAAGSLDRLRAALPALEGNVVVVQTPPALRGEVDHWGPIGDTLPLMRRVKDEYDPDHRFSPGRYVGACNDGA